MAASIFSLVSSGTYTTDRQRVKQGITKLRGGWVVTDNSVATPSNVVLKLWDSLNAPSAASATPKLILNCNTAMASDTNNIYNMTTIPINNDDGVIFTQGLWVTLTTAILSTSVTGVTALEAYVYILFE